MNNKMVDQATNLKLVAEIEKRPCLYNYTLTSYSRKDLTEKAWSEIGQKINLPGSYLSLSLQFVVEIHEKNKLIKLSIDYKKHT